MQIRLSLSALFFWNKLGVLNRGLLYFPFYNYTLYHFMKMDLGGDWLGGGAGSGFRWLRMGPIAGCCECNDELVISLWT
jgi:hypothetical protein